LLVLMELVLEEGSTQRGLHFSLTSVGALPPIESHDPNDLVDVVDHPLHHDRRLIVPCLLEQLRQGGLAQFFFRYRFTCTFCLNYVASQVEQLFQELDADEHALLVPQSQLLESLAQGPEPR